MVVLLWAGLVVCTQPVAAAPSKPVPSNSSGPSSHAKFLPPATCGLHTSKKPLFTLTGLFCESNDNPNGPTTNDLYQGRPVSQGGRFCDQRQFDVPFRHEFKLAGNYSLPYGVDFGAVLQSYGGLERVIRWTPAARL